MQLNLAEYRDKVLGCWLGKNIGGTLGAPFECRRGVFDVDFYTQETHGEPLPNDDLDLQLVWLNAAEKHGRGVTGSILGEYWLMYITPNWGEYGAGKNNLVAGLIPPLSGYVNNVYRDSCGAFILSEIWACLAPGHPEVAVRYAFEDSTVNHSNEGVYAETFCAAVQSAAFAETDARALIAIGLSFIPTDCGVAKAVHTVLDAYDGGRTWQEARKLVLQAVPATFGLLGTPREQVPADEPEGAMGYDAPSNIGIILIGWLYGEGDFGRSICLATNCGEDADCTAGTLGAILGIIGGASALPDKWLAPIGRNIKTICLNRGDQGMKWPNTVDEMTERVLHLTPRFLGSDWVDVVNTTAGYTIRCHEGDGLVNRRRRRNAFVETDYLDHLARQPFTVSHDFTLFTTRLEYGAEPLIRAGQPLTLRVTIENQFFRQQWLNLRWHLPAGFRVSPGPAVSAPLEQYHCNVGSTTLEFEIVVDELTEPRYDLVLQISSVGHHTQGLIPVVLLTAGRS
ncbi:MAG: ADP-ribosylglycohydrolase family protein [Armatimonadetes bacterium]|nr:ADP-ribosylglycohydrolase family protein [Armatimonadota bacterium]